MHSALGSFVELNNDGENDILTADVETSGGVANFSVGADGDDAAQIRTTEFNGVRIADLTRLEYTTFVENWVDGQAVYIMMSVDFDGAPGGPTDLLFFEPVYQSVDFFPSDPQAALQLATAQTWDALNGGWYSVFGTAGSGPGTGVMSLSGILAAHPNATISFTSLGALRFVAGFGAGAWDDFAGWIDNVVVGVNGTDKTFAFTSNQAPVANADAASAGENQSRSIDVLANDVDADGDTLTLGALSGFAVTSSNAAVNGIDASGAFSVAGNQVQFDPGDLFDALGAGETATVTLTYQTSDGNGHISTATLTLTVNGAADASPIHGSNKSDVIHGDRGGAGQEDAIFGGNGNDALFGEAGADGLWGGNGEDSLSGGAGADRLFGENGNDTLDGGAGDDRLDGGNGSDRLSGGDGADLFAFGRGGGSDVVLDFDAGEGDRLQLLDGIFIRSVRVADVNGDGALDAVLALSNGSVTLYGTGAALDTIAEWQALTVV